MSATISCARFAAGTRSLSRENTLLRLKNRSLEQRLAVLEKQAADLAVERSALDAVLGAAMDAALEVRRP